MKIKSVLALALVALMTVGTAQAKSIVVYFSRADENYSVGTITEGNTAILAEIQSLQDAALSMKTGMDEMSIGAKKINDTGATLSELSDRMEISIDEIGNQIDMFDV